MRNTVRCAGGKSKSEWKDGAVVYTSSKAAKHRVDETFGYDPNRKKSAKPLLVGTACFCVLMYFMFFYKGAKNDVFQNDAQSGKTRTWDSSDSMRPLLPKD